jgi:hypothetical protein
MCEVAGMTPGEKSDAVMWTGSGRQWTPIAYPPQLMPTRIVDGQAPGISYRIEGELVPVLHCALDGSQHVYFEHHIVLWKSPAMQIGMRKLDGSFRRVVAGMDVFMTEAKSAGEIAFSRDGSGHIVPVHLAQGQEIVVREHQFLAATGNVAYTFRRLRSVVNMLSGRSGIFVDRFTARAGEGVVWLHGYGNVFEGLLPFPWVNRCAKSVGIRIQQRVPTVGPAWFTTTSPDRPPFGGPGGILWSPGPLPSPISDHRRACAEAAEPGEYQRYLHLGRPNPPTETAEEPFLKRSWLRARRSTLNPVDGYITTRGCR